MKVVKGIGWPLGIGMFAATVLTFAAPDAASFRQPALARIVFFHLPSALITSFLSVLMAYHGWRYLRTRAAQWDERGTAALEIAALFGMLTMVTGILFSRVQWGAWWQWDPRQTSFLFVLLILLAALALRAGIADARQRALAGAAYAVATLIPVLFLIFVYPRLPYVQQISFHPSQTVSQGLFDGWYRTGVVAVLVTLGWTAALAYRMRVRVGLAERRLEELDGNLEMARDGAAADRVVRPVSLHEER
jgi:heme exporter protein C